MAKKKTYEFPIKGFIKVTRETEDIYINPSHVCTVNSDEREGESSLLFTLVNGDQIRTPSAWVEFPEQA